MKHVVGPSLHKGPRPPSQEDRELHAAFLAGESYRAIARRIGRRPHYVELAIGRVEDERALQSSRTG